MLTSVWIIEFRYRPTVQEAAIWNVYGNHHIDREKAERFVQMLNCDTYMEFRAVEYVRVTHAD